MGVNGHPEGRWNTPRRHRFSQRSPHRVASHDEPRRPYTKIAPMPNNNPVELESTDTQRGLSPSEGRLTPIHTCIRRVSKSGFNATPSQGASPKSRKCSTKPKQATAVRSIPANPHIPKQETAQPRQKPSLESGHPARQQGLASQACRSTL